MNIKYLELLSPAKDEETAIEAILHGADAIYMGASSHGARKSASNNIASIERVVDYAHQFHVKVYATVNTLVYDNEISRVEELCWELYRAGVDSLIIQDLGLLRMKIPPIALHASTQCDIRTPEKALFLEKMGFSQLVLPRELTLTEIKEITSVVNIPVECFVHGALCVSYSGRCGASQFAFQRSGNRGECAQICRLPFTLYNSEGYKIKTNPFLLSLKDLNQSDNLDLLIEAKVSSFKIEGRLKDVNYVRNITALYNEKINNYISRNKDYKRVSYGRSQYSFNPNAYKSFNRGFTNYFLKDRQPLSIASLDTPKSKGEPIGDLGLLNKGDGISYFNSKGEFIGEKINNISSKGLQNRWDKILPLNIEYFRTFDNIWEQQLNNSNSKRIINISLFIDKKGVTVSDERGNKIRLPLDFNPEIATKPLDYYNEFTKFGNSIYEVSQYESELDNKYFIPKSIIGKIRRQIIELLNIANNTTYKFPVRRKEDKDYKFPSKELEFNDNVSNNLAKSFYLSHGVEKIEPALEITNTKKAGLPLMTTRYCLLRELNLCKKTRGRASADTDSKLNKDINKEPLYIKSGNIKFELSFNCKDCEMKVLSTK